MISLKLLKYSRCVRTKKLHYRVKNLKVVQLILSVHLCESCLSTPGRIRKSHLDDSNGHLFFFYFSLFNSKNRNKKAKVAWS